VPKSQQIAIVLDPATARRLVPGMLSHFKPGKFFWLVDALRPKAELLAILRRWKPDGIVIRVLPHTTEVVRKLRVPAVICGGNQAGPFISSVTTDNVQVGQLAARHLLEVGLRHFAFYGVNAEFSLKRESAFAETLRAAGIDCTSHRDGMRGWEHYMELLHDDDLQLVQWLRALPKPVGIFAAHDPLGWHLSQVCRRAGIAVPEECAILSANNDELLCNLAQPPLSSVLMPWDREGAEIALAMDALLDALATRRSPPPEGHVKSLAPPGVATRQSTNLLAVGDPLVRRALQFIRERAWTPITVGDILREVPISRRRLETEFRRQLGRSPKEEITRVRMERAKPLLTGTDFSIPLVAERCGFNYTERFTLAFRREMKITPSAFRRNNRLGGR
jgi:LacI family transcriptional regulator